MRRQLGLLFGIPALACFWAAGCGRPAASEGDPTLQESFQTAAPEVQQIAARADMQLRAGQTVEATRTLAPLITGRPLTDPQRQAVGAALRQINQAVAAHPELDTREMYELRARMFKAAHSGPRF